MDCRSAPNPGAAKCNASSADTNPRKRELIVRQTGFHAARRGFLCPNIRPRRLLERRKLPEYRFSLNAALKCLYQRDLFLGRLSRAGVHIHPLPTLFSPLRWVLCRADVFRHARLYGFFPRRGRLRNILCLRWRGGLRRGWGFGLLRRGLRAQQTQFLLTFRFFGN